MICNCATCAHRACLSCRATFRTGDLVRGHCHDCLSEAPEPFDGNVLRLEHPQRRPTVDPERVRTRSLDDLRWFFVDADGDLGMHGNSFEPGSAIVKPDYSPERIGSSKNRTVDRADGGEEVRPSVWVQQRVGVSVARDPTDRSLAVAGRYNRIMMIWRALPQRVKRLLQRRFEYHRGAEGGPSDIPRVYPKLGAAFREMSGVVSYLMDEAGTIEPDKLTKSDVDGWANRSRRECERAMAEYDAAAQDYDWTWRKDQRRMRALPLPPLKITRASTG